MDQPRTLEELKQAYRQYGEEFRAQLDTIEALESLGRLSADKIFAIMMRNDEAELAQLTNEVVRRVKPESKKVAERAAATNLLGQLNVVKGDEGKELALVLLTELDGYMYSIHEELLKPENNLDRLKLFQVVNWLRSILEKPKLDSRDILMLERLPANLEAEIYGKYGSPNLEDDEVLKEIQARLNVFEAERKVAKRAAAEANAKKAALVPLFAELERQREALATAERTLAGETSRRAGMGGVVPQRIRNAVTSATAAVAAAEKAIRNAGGNLGAPVVANVVPSMVPVVAANAPRASAGEAEVPSGAAAGQSQPLTAEQRAAAILARITAAQAGRTSGSGGKRTMKKKSKKTKKAKKSHKSRRHQRK